MGLMVMLLYQDRVQQIPTLQDNGQRRIKPQINIKIADVRFVAYGSRITNEKSPHKSMGKNI